MSNTNDSFAPLDAHRAEWSERLEDFFDATLDATAHAAVDAHLASCEWCRGDIAALRELDVSLRNAIKAPALSNEFDRRLRTRIADLDDEMLARARQRAREALEREAQGFARSWQHRKRRWLLDSIAAAACLVAITLTIRAIGLWDFLGGKLLVAFSAGINAQNLGTLAITSTVIGVAVAALLARSRH